MLICLGILWLLQKSCSKEAGWVETGWLGLNEEKNSKVRKGGGDGGVSYLTYLDILTQKENWYSYNGAFLAGRKQSDMESFTNQELL